MQDLHLFQDTLRTEIQFYWIFCWLFFFRQNAYLTNFNNSIVFYIFTFFNIKIKFFVIKKKNQLHISVIIFSLCTFFFEFFISKILTCFVLILAKKKIFKKNQLHIFTIFLLYISIVFFSTTSPAPQVIINGSIIFEKNLVFFF